MKEIKDKKHMPDFVTVLQWPDGNGVSKITLMGKEIPFYNYENGLLIFTKDNPVNPDDVKKLNYQFSVSVVAFTYDDYMKWDKNREHVLTPVHFDEKNESDIDIYKIKKELKDVEVVDESSD